MDPRGDVSRFERRERADGVDEQPAWAQHGGCCHGERNLEIGQTRQRALLDAPPGVGPAAQHAEAAARRVDEDAVKPGPDLTEVVAKGRACPSATTHATCVSPRRAAAVCTKRKRPACRSAATTRPVPPSCSAIAVALPPGAAATSSTRSPVPLRGTSRPLGLPDLVALRGLLRRPGARPCPQRRARAPPLGRACPR